MNARLNVLVVKVDESTSVGERLYGMECAMNGVLAKYQKDFWRVGHRSKFRFTKGNLAADSYIDLNLYNNSTGSWEHYSILLSVCESEDAKNDS